MEKTVEIEKTVTEEEQLTLCDGCKREVDENGHRDVQCDFCSVCGSEYVEDDEPPEDVLTADQWTDARGSDDFSPESNLSAVRFSVGLSVAITTLSLIVGFAISGANGFLIAMPLVLVIGLFAMGCLRDFKSQYVELVKDDS